MKPQIILGIDPGTQVTGYGIIRQKADSSWEPVDFGAIRQPPSSRGNHRYLVIFDAIEHLIEKFHPEVVVVETQFVYKNVQSALKLGMARGAALIAALRHKLLTAEYTPRKVKLAVVGHGGASKHQVQQMIQMHLKLPHPPNPTDAADALAIALCHAYNKEFPCSNSSAAG